MIPGIVASRRYGVAGVDTVGALAYRTGSTVFVNGGSVVPLNAESYDDAGYHDNTTNNSRLTVPSGVTRGRVVGGASVGATGSARLRKNGGAYLGAAHMFTVTSGVELNSVTGAIVSVTAGDYFELENGNGNDNFDPDQTWLSFEPFDAAVKSALVNKSANQAYSASATVIQDFGAEQYDSGAFHDNSTNNSRLTVPSGVTLVRLSTSIAVTNTSGAGQVVLNLRKNAASVRGMFFNDLETNTTTRWVSGVSAPLVVTTGDYFDVALFNSQAGNSLNNDLTWFQIEELPSGHEYALVYKTANQILTSSVQNILTWDAEEVDTSGIHDNATNNSRMTVPSGKTRARLSFNLKTGSSAVQFDATVIKNGSTVVPGLPAQGTDTGGTDNLNGFGAWIDVTPGDYFELRVLPSGAGTSITAIEETWFCMEVA